MNVHIAIYLLAKSVLGLVYIDSKLQWCEGQVMELQLNYLFILLHFFKRGIVYRFQW